MSTASEPLIRLVEGEIVTYTLTAKRAGVAENLTGKTVTAYAHDNDEAARGTNIINGLVCTVTSPTDGVFTVAITTTHSLIAASKTDVKGIIGFLITASGYAEWTLFEEFVISRNPFLNI